MKSCRAQRSVATVVLRQIWPLVLVWGFEAVIKQKIEC